MSIGRYVYLRCINKECLGKGQQQTFFLIDNKGRNFSYDNTVYLWTSLAYALRL